MQISRIAAEGLKHEYQVVVPAKDVEKKIMDRLLVVGKSVKIPGFRPGKVPTTVLKQRFGLEARTEALEQILTNSIQQIIKDNEFRQATQPKVHVESMDEDKDFSVRVEFELLPNIELKDFKKIKLEKMVVDVTDEQVQERLEMILKNHKKYDSLEAPRAVIMGDLIHCDVENQPAVEGNILKDFPKHVHLVAGSDDHLVSGEIEKLIIGKNVGDVVEVTEKFPQTANLQELANKEIKLVVKITAIEQSLVFELNDEFAQDLKCEDFEDLKQRVRETMSREYSDLARMKVKRHLLDELSKAYSFDLPASLVEGEFDMIWKRLQDELAAAQATGNLEHDDDRTEDQLKEEYRTISERRVRLGLIISEVSRLHNIKVEEFEIRQAIYREAMNYPDQVQEVLKYFQKNPNAIEQISAPILEDKVVDFILDKVDLTEKKVDVKHLLEAIRGVVPGFETEEETLKA